MSKYKLGRNVTEHYTSLEELRVAWGKNPISKRTKDKKKLETQKEKFIKNKKCKGCGNPMSFIVGTNVMCCKNPNCKGIKIKATDQDGRDIFVNSNMLLDEKGTEIGMSLFS